MGANIQREAIIQASARIAALREVIAKNREELKQAEGQLDRLLAGDYSQPILPLSAGEKDVDRTLNQQIIDTLDSFAMDRDFSAEELTELIPGANLTSVRSALPRLADAIKIQRSARGRYQSIHSPHKLAEVS